MLKKFNILMVACATLVTAFAYASGDNDNDDSESSEQDNARELSQQGIILPLPTLIEQAQKIHPGKILEVEFKQGPKFFRYEIEILDGKGIVWEMEFNAVTGDLVKLEQDN